MNLLNKVDVKKSKQEFIEETDIVCDVCKRGKMVIRHSRGQFAAVFLPVKIPKNSFVMIKGTLLL